MEYTEEQLLSLSGIQHYAFCERQWALIHVEQQWLESVLTYEGRQIHQRVDDVYFQESRGDVLIRRAVPLVSYTLGTYGVADVVEYHRSESGSSKQGVTLSDRDGEWFPFPVEYKRGKPKPSDWDELQLCAQAMCLEEMLGVIVPEGAIFYKEWERRISVPFHESLRERVQSLFENMHQLFHEGSTPVAKYNSKCRNCSLADICVPKLKRSVKPYLNQLLADEGEGEEDE
ncbi:CRISPR-associated protein Cas4 [Paenibacillus profundus]|uniref:CRISPR-associated exonuclease Cas4 n=1 Tax=Paenibacillus profundus TaxID=1173085 RepID=A0ABS8YNY2_9BACL|nr:CRISPR-associated protein Cas4 [Paenibacillus profundus]MCE5173523.1 CRISPR-associated protein Cas4 [Paenibacillus profundus]